jgi:hypothetical protein
MRENFPVGQNAHGIPDDHTLIGVRGFQRKATYCRRPSLSVDRYGRPEWLALAHKLRSPVHRPVATLRGLLALIAIEPIAGRPIVGKPIAVECMAFSKSPRAQGGSDLEERDGAGWRAAPRCVAAGAAAAPLP